MLRKEPSWRMAVMRTKAVCFAKGAVQRVDSQATGWEKTCAKHTPDREPLHTHKELTQPQMRDHMWSHGLRPIIDASP